MKEGRLVNIGECLWLGEYGWCETVVVRVSSSDGAGGGQCEPFAFPVVYKVILRG